MVSSSVLSCLVLYLLDLPDAASDTLVLKQPQQMIGPLLKILVDDLGDLWVVCNLGVEGFAGNGVDVCDKLVSDG